MLSLVIPVYRNEDSIHELLEAIGHLNRELCGQLEAVLVIDGSPDRCYERLRFALPRQPYRAKLLLLTRNFGSFAAIRAGLEAGGGERFAVMAADLQEPPDLVIAMDHALRRDEADVVIGVRESRADPILARLPAAVFWALYRRFVIPEVPPGGVDVFGCNRSFRNQLLQLEERHSSLIAQIFWLGYRRKTIGYVRNERRHGKSGWTFRKKLNYLMDSIFSFTDLPIRLLIRVGGGTAFLSLVFALALVILRLAGGINVPGYAATMVAIVFFGSLNLFWLGIVGDYAWRTYENTKCRPLHVVLRTHEYNGN
jgi:glycosyltransferase involved in cell wall biosynthesis